MELKILWCAGIRRALVEQAMRTLNENNKNFLCAHRRTRIHLNVVYEKVLFPFLLLSFSCCFRFRFSCFLHRVSFYFYFRCRLYRMAFQLPIVRFFNFLFFSHSLLSFLSKTRTHSRRRRRRRNTQKTHHNQSKTKGKKRKEKKTKEEKLEQNKYRRTER